MSHGHLLSALPAATKMSQSSFQSPIFGFDCKVSSYTSDLCSGSKLSCKYVDPVSLQTKIKCLTSCSFRLSKGMFWQSISLMTRSPSTPSWQGPVWILFKINLPDGLTKDKEACQAVWGSAHLRHQASSAERERDPDTNLPPPWLKGCLWRAACGNFQRCAPSTV